MIAIQDGDWLDAALEGADAGVLTEALAADPGALGVAVPDPHGHAEDLRRVDAR